MKSFTYLFSFVFLTLLISAKPQSNNYIIIDEYYDLTNSLPKGYKKDGTVDYTKYLQNAINKYAKVKFPNFEIMTEGLFLRSNSEVCFQDKSVLKLKPTSRDRYQILGLHGVENVKIYNARLIGDKNMHLGKTGEWGFGIDIRNSKNILISKANITNCWGDGIVIAYGTRGFSGSKTYKTSDIVIEGINISNCRRNGITIGGVKNLSISNGKIDKIKGTAPQAAIMIEPDDSNYTLSNISISNLELSNSTSGIAVNLRVYVSQYKQNEFGLSLSNIIASDNYYGFYFSVPVSNENFKKLTGNVYLENLKSNNNKFAFENKDKNNLMTKITIKKILINDKVPTKEALLKTSTKENISFEN